MKKRKKINVNFYKRRARKIERNNLRRTIKREKRKILFKNDKKEVYSRNYRKIEIKAPNVLSLVNNYEESMHFLLEIYKTIPSKNEYIFVNLQSCSSITLDAVALLLAATHHHIGKIAGNLPENASSKRMLISSGFLSRFKLSTGLLQHKHLIEEAKKRNFVKKVGKSVDSTIVKDVITTSIGDKVIGKRNKHRASYEILVECMENTIHHASGKSSEIIEWVIMSYFDKTSNTGYITFLDLGIGVFNSLNQKIFRNVVNNLFNISNKELARKLVKGELESITKDKVRGKGFPMIYGKAKQSPYIKNATLISNDVYLNMNSDTYLSVKNKLNGTLICWEVQSK